MSGFNADAYIRYLATKFVFDEIEDDNPEKAINSLVDDACGDTGLLQRLIETYDVVTFTDGSGTLRKNKLASLVTDTGRSQCFINKVEFETNN